MTYVYSKTLWKDKADGIDGTIIDAAKLNNMESGIYNSYEHSNKLNEKLSAELFEMSQEIKDAKGDEETLELKLIDMENRAAENVAKQYLEATTDNGHMKVENCYNGLTKDLSLKGRTLQNLGGTVKATHNHYNSLIIMPYAPKASTKYTLSITNNAQHDVVYYLNENFFVGGGHYTTVKAGETTVKIIETLSTVLQTDRTLIKSGMKEPTYFNLDVIFLEGEPQYIPSCFEGIKSLGEEDNNRISILSCGKNLTFDDKDNPDIYYSSSGGGTEAIKYDKNEQAFYTNLHRNRIFTNLKPNTQYTFSIDLKIKEQKSTYQILHHFNNGYAGNIGGGISNEWNRFNGTITTNSKGEFYYTIYKLFFRNAQLEEGITATPYEEYKADKKDILLPVQGGAKGFDDSTADESYDNGDYLQKVDRVVLNGTENIGLNGETETEVSFIFHNILGGKITTKFITDGDFSRIRFSATSGKLVVNISKSIIPTLDVNLFKQYLSSKNRTIYYELAEPILHKAETQQNNNPATFKDITHMSCLNKIAPSSMSAKFPVDVAATFSRLNRENKEQELKNIELKKENLELQNKASDLTVENEMQQLDIDTNMLATIDLFEMIIGATKSIKGGDGKMVEVYVSMIIKGKKKLEDVPAIIRPQVEQMLKDLGVIS